MKPRIHPLLLLIAFCHGEQLMMMRLTDDKRYIQNNALSTVDHDSCRDASMEFHDNADYEDADEYGEDSDDPVCHFSRVKTDVEEEFGVKSCCPFHGFIETADCDGTDKDGTPKHFVGHEVCISHEAIENGDKVHKAKVDISCPENCKFVSGFVNNGDHKVEFNNQSLTVGNKTYDSGNFCIGIRCDNAGEKFDHWYEACGECVEDIGKANEDLSERFGKVAQCCGPDGKLKFSNSVVSCLNGTLDKEASNCTWKNKKTLTFVSNEKLTNESGVMCTSMTNEMKEGGLKCEEQCPGNENCIQNCLNPGEGFIWENKTSGKVSRTLAEIVGLSSTLFVSPKKREFSSKDNNINLFPEWQCQERVNFHKDGSISKVEDESAVAQYGEFCIQALAGDTDRGTYMIKTNWTKDENAKEVKNFKYYNTILCISISCLIATIIIYALFREALLKSEYNKIMMNFASMVMIAFLTLVIMQNLSAEEMTKTTCTISTIINQFSFIAAFSLLTLMSYNICRQIHGMRVMDASKRFMRRIAVAYSIPTVISILTIIVEVAAPHCADARPKFGMKSCHFYGGLGKFIFLYFPILILLIINTVMFVYIAYNIFKNSQSNSTSKKTSRSEKADKMCIYLRLFFGMGIIWYFELLAFALAPYNLNPNVFVLTDTLNMLQGVWVFVIFVCKRNVIKVVQGKSTRLYSIARQMSRQLSTSSNKAEGSKRPPLLGQLSETKMSSFSETEASTETKL